MEAGSGYDPLLKPIAEAAVIDIEALQARALALETTGVTAQAQVNFAFRSGVTVADGAPLVVFANGTADGLTLVDSKSVAYRWNNGGTPPAIACSESLPQDLDDTAAVVIHALVSKSGNTVGDATKITYGAFFQTVAAAHDADTDHGGDTAAVVGNAAAKTVTELTFSIAANVVPPAPCSLTLTIKPKDGTLGTDDFLLHALWIEYKRKALTS